MMQEGGMVTQEASVTTKNISLIAILRSVQYPLLALYLMLVPRFLGPENYGIYVLYMSIVAIVTSLIDLGITQIFGRFIPELKIRDDAKLGSRLPTNILAFKMTISLITAILMIPLLFIIYGKQYPTNYYFLIAIAVIITDIGNVPNALLFGLNEMGKYALRDPIRRVLSLTFVLLFYRYFGLVGALLSPIFTEIFLIIINFVFTHKYFHLQSFKFDISFLLPYLRFGFIFSISFGILTLWQRIGNVLIEYITKSAKEVAIFDMPNQILLVTASFSLFLISALTPIFTQLMLTGKEEKMVIWSKLITKYTQILSLLIYAGYLLTSRNLIPIFIGSEYSDIFVNGAILLLSMFPMAFSGIGYVLSVVNKQPRRYFHALSISLITFLVISILLIPRFASLGASIAMFVSYVIQAIIMWNDFPSVLNPCFQEMGKSLLPGLILAPFLLVHGNLVVNLILFVIFAIFYLLILLAMRILSLNEIGNVYRAIKQPTLSMAKGS